MDSDDLKKYAYQKKESMLKQYIEDIKILLEHGATQKSIIKYLKEKKNETTTQSNLSKFIKKYITKEPYTPPIKQELVQEEKTKPKKLRDSIFDDD